MAAISWTVPRKWLLGETPTAAQLNAHIRDNMLWLRTAWGCKVRLIANQTLANNVQDDVPWPSGGVDWDSNSMWNSGLQSRITPGMAGKYFCVATVQFAADPTGVRWAYIRESGGTPSGAARLSAVNGEATAYGWVGEIEFGASDYIELEVKQTSGGPLDLTFAGAAAPLNHGTSLTVMWAGA